MTSQEDNKRYSIGNMPSIMPPQAYGISPLNQSKYSLYSQQQQQQQQQLYVVHNNNPMHTIPEESISQCLSVFSQIEVSNSPGKNLRNSNIFKGYSDNDSETGIPMFSANGNMAMINDDGNSNKNNRDNSSKELLVMTIEIENGRYDRIHVYENDDPVEVARSFCLKHGLNLMVIDPLAQNILNNLEQVLYDRQQKNKLTYDKENLNIQFSSQNCIKSTESNNNSNVSYSNNGSGYNGINNTNDSLIVDDSRNSNNSNGNSTWDFKKRLQLAETKSFSNSRAYLDDTKPQLDHYYHHHYNNSSNNHSKLGKRLASPISNNNNTHNRSTKSLNVSYENLNTSSLYNGNSNDITIGTNTSNYSNLNSSVIYGNKGKREKTPEVKNKKRNKLNLKPTINDASGNNEHMHVKTSSNWAKDVERHDLTFTPKINSNSKNIALSRNGFSRTPVHERLHNMAIQRINKSQVKQREQDAQLSPSPVRHVARSVSQSDINYGSFLYHKGLKRQEELMKDLKYKKMELLEQEEMECTFKPIVNPISHEIVTNKNRYEPPEEILIRFGKEAKEKLDRQRSMKNIQEIENCSFKPDINPISEKIAIEKDKEKGLSNGGDRCLKLFNDHKNRITQQEARQKSYEQQYTFTPQVNTYQSKLLEKTTFHDRNRKLIEKFEKMEVLKKQKEYEQLHDPQSGTPLFKPKTGRAPKDRNRENMPIGNYLYNQRMHLEDAKRNLLEKEQKTLEDLMAKSNEKSQLMLENIKKKRLQEIFHAFDSDDDGLISSTNIDITAIDPDCLEVLAPLLYEMEESNETLNENEFTDACEKFIKTLNIQDRSILLFGKRDSNSKFNDGCTFKPQINKKSKQMAETRRPFTGAKLYDLYVEEKKATEEKLRQERERRMQDELKECSFKPSLNNSYNGTMTNSQIMDNKFYMFNNYI